MPDVAPTRPVRIAPIVDLPAPDSPTSANVSPAATVKDTSSTATTPAFAEPNRFVRWDTRTTGELCTPLEASPAGLLLTVRSGRYRQRWQVGVELASGDLDGSMTSHLAAGANDERWRPLAAYSKPHRASVNKRTRVARVGSRYGGSCDDRDVVEPPVERRTRRDKPTRIGVYRPICKRGGVSNLHNLPGSGCPGPRGT